MRHPFFWQKLQKLHLHKDYLPETYSIERLRLMDSKKNFLALYKSEFIAFSKYLSELELNLDELETNEILNLIEKYNQQQTTTRKYLKFVLYFSNHNLSQYKLRSESDCFAYNKHPMTKSGLRLLTGNQQNCIVMHQGGAIYIHPKIRGDFSKNQHGISHASLAPLDGSALCFAGLLVHQEEKGWILSNLSGHYFPRATQMRHFLLTLLERGFDLKPLTIQLWIPNNPHYPSDRDEDYCIIEENAFKFLKRVSNNMAKLDYLDSSKDIPIANEVANLVQI